MKRFATTALILILLVSGIVYPLMAYHAYNGTFRVIIDFGDGRFVWGDISADNAMNATISLCDNAGIALNYTTYIIGGEEHMFVNSIGGKSNNYPEAWWHFWYYDEKNDTWVYSTVSADSVCLNTSDSICWNYISDYELFVSAPQSPSTPESPEPIICYLGTSTNNRVYDQYTGNDVLHAVPTGAGSIMSSPIAFGDKVVVSTCNKGTYCINLSGEVIWHNWINSTSTPLLYDYLYIGATDGVMYMVDPENGSIVKSVLLTTHGGPVGIVSPPKICDGRIYVPLFNYSGGYGEIVCMQPNMSTIWRVKLPSSPYFSSPCVYDGKIYLGLIGAYDYRNMSYSEPYGVVCLDKNGSMRWFFKTNGSVASSVLVLDNTLYFSCKDGKLYSISTSGKLKWAKNLPSSSVSTPLYFNGRIYVGYGGIGAHGGLVCINASTGREIWTKSIGSVEASPITEKEHVLVITNTNESTLYCLDKDGSVLWKHIFYPKNYAISTPIIYKGHIIACTDSGNIYVFGDAKPNVDLCVKRDSENSNVFYITTSVFNETGDLNITLDFGDGTVISAVLSANRTTYKHTYAPGSYQVRLVVEDDEGNIVVKSRKIMVQEEPNIIVVIAASMIAVIVIILIVVLGRKHIVK